MQPVELILSNNFSIILIFILGSPIPYYPRAEYEKKGFTEKWTRHLFLRFPTRRCCRHLGFSVEDTAWVNSAVPVVDVVGPPIAGIVADKMGNFRLFMAAVTFLNGVASLLLLAIPTFVLKLRKLQDVTSSCTLSFVDINTKVLSQYGLRTGPHYKAGP